MDEGFLNQHGGSNFLDSDLQVTKELMMYIFNIFLHIY